MLRRGLFPADEHRVDEDSHDDSHETKYLLIGQIAEMSGVVVSAVEFYDEAENAVQHEISRKGEAIHWVPSFSQIPENKKNDEQPACAVKLRWMDCQRPLGVRRYEPQALMEVPCGAPGGKGYRPRELACFAKATSMHKTS